MVLLPHPLMQAVQCSAGQGSAVQCRAVQCSAVQAVQCSAVQCSAGSFPTVRHPGLIERLLICTSGFHSLLYRLPQTMDQHKLYQISMTQDLDISLF